MSIPQVKYSEAALLGWVVIRATADMERDGTALELLRRALEASDPAPPLELEGPG